MLKDKAIENLAAGDLLLERGHVNAATSRYYYAMYQAAVHRLTRLGFQPAKVRSGAIEWDHSMVLNHTFTLRRSWDDRDLYGAMRRARRVADYADSAVTMADLEARVDRITEFVKELTA